MKVGWHCQAVRIFWILPSRNRGYPQGLCSVADAISGLSTRGAMAHVNIEDAREEWESGKGYGIGGFEDVSLKIGLRRVSGRASR